MGCIVAIVGILQLFLILWGFSVSPILGILLLIVIVGLEFYLGTTLGNKEDKLKKNIINKLSEIKKQLTDFTISQEFCSYDYQSEILIDEERKKVCFLFESCNRPEIYDYKDILQSEILENGETVITTSRTSQLRGAIIGGVLAGGVGAVVGGLSGRKTSELEISKIDLKVVVNNTKSPNKVINFFAAGKDLNGKLMPIKKDSTQYKEAINAANHWHSLLSILLKRDLSINLEKKEAPDTKYSAIKKLSSVLSLVAKKKELEISRTNKSVADEIIKLSDLLKQGLITQYEFNKLKKKFLS